MSKYKRRIRNIYKKAQEEAFSISRSRLERFLECPRCLYLDRGMGIDRPKMPGWALNSAVDTLLKNEFDLLRKNGETHTLMKKYKIDAVPFKHPDLPIWRDDIYQYVGASVIHQQTNLKICGIIDDIWINKKEELLIVDYKATSTKEEISLEDKYKQGYKKQVELYQWIFRQMGFQVNDTAYFVFANATKNRPKFDGKLEFELSIISHKGDDSWVEPIIFKIKECLESDTIPESGDDCEYCVYCLAREEHENKD